jgi:hypothetical protein
MTQIGYRERLVDIWLPLLVMGVYLSATGKGFLTASPILACTVYAFVQPFVRFFVMDRIREPMEEANQAGMYLLGAAVLYSAVGMMVVEMVT